MGSPHMQRRKGTWNQAGLGNPSKVPSLSKQYFGCLYIKDVPESPPAAAAALCTQSPVGLIRPWMLEGEQQGQHVWDMKGSAEHGLGATAPPRHITHHYLNVFNVFIHSKELQMTKGNDDKQATLTNAAQIFISLTTDTTQHICITKCKNMPRLCIIVRGNMEKKSLNLLGMALIS